MSCRNPFPKRPRQAVAAGFLSQMLQTGSRSPKRVCWYLIDAALCHPVAKRWIVPVRIDLSSFKVNRKRERRLRQM